MTLYIVNIPYDTTEQRLREAFSAYGEVKRVRIPIGDFSRPRGFAFVDMPDRPHAERAMRQLDNTDFCGRIISVREAMNA